MGHFTHHQYKDSKFPTLFNTLTGVRLYLTVVLTCISMVMSRVECVTI